MISAANQSTLINADTILFRNSVLDKQLRDEHLISTDVIDDGKCIFRTLSVNVYGNKENHIALCHSGASYLAGQLINSSVADIVTLRQLLCIRYMTGGK